MCQLCRMSLCHPRCPNASDPPAVFHCAGCGESIYPGYEYARIGGVEYCEECVDNMPYCALIPLLGGEWKSVQKGESVKCSDCEEELPAGTEYGIVDGAVLCEDCADEIPYCDLITRLSGDWRTASEEDIYDGYDG